MEKESFNLPESAKRALVVSCYKWDWQQVLTLEGALELKNLGFKVDLLELSGFNVNPFKEAMKILTSKSVRISKKIKTLEKYQITVNRPFFLIFVGNIGIKLMLFFRIKVFKKLGARWNIVYPGLVDLTGDINVNPEENRRLVRSALIQDYVFGKVLHNWSKDKPKYDFVLIVNGRFPLNRASAFFFKQRASEVQYIEYGANRNKFQMYRVSPHSMKNRQDLFERFMLSSMSLSEKNHLVGKDFFEKRRNFDSQANINWTRHMKNSILPKFDVSKKTCTFFPTSEKEFAGVRDEVLRGEFENQFDALTTLIESLGTEWEIFVRRHPAAKDDSIDPEAKIWAKFRSFNNVHIIEPGSNIDSYELGLNSDLVAHFSSFIGPELIFLGHQNVITLGPTEWKSLDSTRHLGSASKLNEYIKSHANTRPEVDICLLGYYMATFGKDFRQYRWIEGKSRWTLSK